MVLRSGESTRSWSQGFCFLLSLDPGGGEWMGPKDWIFFLTLVTLGEGVGGSGRVGIPPATKEPQTPKIDPQTWVAPSPPPPSGGGRVVGSDPPPSGRWVGWGPGVHPPPPGAKENLWWVRLTLPLRGTPTTLWVCGSPPPEAGFWPSLAFLGGKVPDFIIYLFILFG